MSEGQHGDAREKQKGLRPFDRLVIGLLCSVLALSLIPIPEEFKPVDLLSEESRGALLRSLFRPPKMTFSVTRPEVEEDEQGDALGQIAPDGLPWDFVPEQKTKPKEAQNPKNIDDSKQASASQKGWLELRTSSNDSKLRRVAEEVQAPGSQFIVPCLYGELPDCRQDVLSPLVTKLAAVISGERSTPVRFTTFGNSLIASDHVTDIVRERLVEYFGDAGRGYLLPDRLSKEAGRRVRTGYGSRGWDIHTVAQKNKQRTGFGVAGSLHSSSQKGDKITWKLNGADHATIWVQRHAETSGFTVQVDGELKLRVPADELRSDKASVQAFHLEELMGHQELTLKALGPDLVVHGIDMLKDKSGVVFDTIGVPAADGEMYFTEIDKDVLKEQLDAMRPDAFVLMLGGNEIRSISFGWKTIQEIETSYTQFITALKAMRPEATCLAISPIDAVKAYGGGQVLKTRPEVQPVIDMQKRVAAEMGCSYFNLFEAMGGSGSFQRFHRANLVHADLVHPRGAGGDVLGQLIADAFFDYLKDAPIVEQDDQGQQDRLQASSRIVPLKRLRGLKPPQRNWGRLLRTASSAAEQIRHRSAQPRYVGSLCDASSQASLSCAVEEIVRQDVQNYQSFEAGLRDETDTEPAVVIFLEPEDQTYGLIRSAWRHHMRTRSSYPSDCIAISYDGAPDTMGCWTFDVMKALGGRGNDTLWQSHGFMNQSGGLSEAGFLRVAHHLDHDLKIYLKQPGFSSRGGL